jgi:protease-4
VKGVRFVIGFLLVATVISVAVMLLLYVVVTQEPRVPQHATLVLSPSGDLPEVLPDFAFGAGDELTVRAYVDLIRKAKNDARIDGILLRPGGINSPFWANLQELREAIDDFKSSGKMSMRGSRGGDREYFLSSVADKIYLLPSASLDLTGVASYEVSARDLRLDRHGPDFLRW